MFSPLLFLFNNQRLLHPHVYHLLFHVMLLCFLVQDAHDHFPYALEWMVGDSLGNTKWQTIPLMKVGGDKKVQIRKALKDVLAAAISSKPKENDND